MLQWLRLSSVGKRISGLQEKTPIGHFPQIRNQTHDFRELVEWKWINWEIRSRFVFLGVEPFAQKCVIEEGNQPK